jgi:hypothetical protein
MSPSQFATAVLQHLGKPVTSANLKAMVGWIHAEGGHWHNNARFNPLNTTQPAPGAGNTGSQGNIKVYRDWNQGINATVQTLRNGHYTDILQALSHGNDPNAVANAIGASPWGTSASLVNATIGSTGHVSEPTLASHATSKISHTPPTTTTDTSGALTDALLAAGSGKVKGSLHSDILGHAAALVQSGAYTTTTPGHADVRSVSHAAQSDPAMAGKGTLDHFDGKPVAGWIASELRWARSHGWTGSVTSGFRTDAEQTRIYKSGVRPAAVPKSMGGSGSNHEGLKYPLGAVDVSNAAQLASVLRNKPGGSKLIYAGAKDPVHFSHPHGGGY